MARKIYETILALGLGLTAFSPLVLADQWSGPYIGIGGGYGIANEDLNFAPGPLLGGVIGGNLEIDGLASKGGFLSLSAGYDHQLNRSLVAGVFVDYDFADIDGDISVNLGGPGGLDASADFQIEKQLSIGGRLGVLISPSTLLFGTAGYAHVETSDINFNVSAGGFGVSGVLAAVPNLDGYFLGGGIETKLGHGLSLKAEYRYTDLGPERIELLPGILPPGFVTSTLEPIIQTGRLSLNYRFGEHDGDVADDAARAIAKSWTGGYVAASIGYGAADNQISLFNQPGFPLPFNATIDGAGFKGGAFGVGGGYDIQAGRFVFGALADVQRDTLRNDVSANLNILGLVGIGADVRTRIDDIFMTGVRLGYLTSPDTLVFASGGYANADVGDARFNVNLSVLGGPPVPIASGTLIEGKRFSGFFLGGGIEARLTDAISLKAEYRYIDLGSDRVVLLPDLAPAINDVVATEIDPTIQTGMVSIVYRFGGREEPRAPLK